jgi:hypothetical protein
MRLMETCSRNIYYSFQHTHHAWISVNLLLNNMNNQNLYNRWFWFSFVLTMEKYFKSQYALTYSKSNDSKIITSTCTEIANAGLLIVEPVWKPCVFNNEFPRSHR